MLPLAKYIYKQTQTLTWDGHIHLFNHESSIKKPENFSKYVGFMDIEFNKLKKINVLDAYKRYIENDYNKNTDILLATGVTIEDIKKVYNAYPKIIKGFGELKCYDLYKGEKLPFKKMNFVRQVLKFSDENGCKPVYIHWELNDVNDLTRLSNAIKDYPHIPIVLCHFGINDYNSDFAVNAAAQLQREHGNLWLDMSFTATEYFAKNLMMLSNFDYSRIIVGTDYNNRIFTDDFTDEDRTNVINKLNTVVNYLRINNSENIKKLFGIH